MRKYILLISLTVSILCAFSQDEYLSGFIITNSNDTIYGELKNERDIFFGLYCIFVDSNGIMNLFYPTEIKAYYLSNDRFFVSKKIVLNNIHQTMFSQILIAGEITVFRVKDINRKYHYYIEKSGIGINEIYDNIERTVVNENGTFIQTLIPGINVLTYYTMDVPKLKPTIERFNLLHSKPLVDIAKEYHEAVCEDYDCSIYFYEY